MLEQLRPIVLFRLNDKVWCLSFQSRARYIYRRKRHGSMCLTLSLAILSATATVAHSQE